MPLGSNGWNLGLGELVLDLQEVATDLAGHIASWDWNAAIEDMGEIGGLLRALVVVELKIEEAEELEERVVDMPIKEIEDT